MAYSLEGVSDLGAISSEQSKRTAGLDISAIAGTDSTDTIITDVEGKTVTISIEGIRRDLTGSVGLSAFYAQLKALIPTDQTGLTRSYVSEILGTLNVKIDSIDVTYEQAKPNLLFYTIKLIQSSTLV